MDPKDLVWLAGLLEGEGSFMRPAPSAPRLPIVRVSMTDRDVVEHAARLMGVSVCRHQLSEAKPYYKDVWIATAKGTRARNLMLLVRPHMGYRRKEQIDRALSGNVFLPGDGPKISMKQAQQIRRRFASGESAAKLAAEFGVSKSLVYRIKYGKRAS
jgi:hypothetical protein